MTPDVFVVSDNVLSPLGLTTAENFEQLVKNGTAIKEHHDSNFSNHPFYAALFDKKTVFIDGGGQDGYTQFEQLIIASISKALENTDIDPGDKKTILIISSTKGNVSLLESGSAYPATRDRVALHTSSRLVAKHFGFANKPVIISNACVSGSLAILTGMRLIRSGQYDHAVIVGGDLITKFIFSGFEAFRVISNGHCKPFDKARTGISLGEGAGTLVLSSDNKYAGSIQIKGGAMSNDANHISGPSRTGQELADAIGRALLDAGMQTDDIDFISAHGTATVYNDEMEANAITLAGLQDVPVNSLKGYYGHTLGAAGLIESIISIHSLKEMTVLPTRGFEQSGVTKTLNVCHTLLRAPLRNCLKTASGFGGCNAALVFGGAADRGE